MTTNTSTSELRSTRVQVMPWWRRWIVLLPIFTIALLVRWHYAPDPGYVGDLDHFARWVRVIDANGVLHFYDADLRFGVWDRTYPPLSTLPFEAIRLIYGGAPQSRAALQDPVYVTLLKLMPMLAELGLIVAVYVWLIERPVLRTVIPSLLAIFPGLIATTAWWGQYDAPFVLFVVLSLMAINRDKPLAAWLLFAVAVMLKQPAVVIGPLLLVLTYRRYGWRSALVGLAASGTLCAVIVAPFFLNSGLDALSPYLKSSDAFPFLTNNAFNFWYAIASIHKGSLLQFRQYPDASSVLGAFTFKEAGLFMFVVLVLLVMVVMWRRADEKKEFVWAAAMFMGFFMLPTQVHERYIYPAAVLLLIAVAQDSRLWIIAAGVAVTFTYNILAILVPNHYRSGTYGAEWLAFPTAIANIVLLVSILWIAVVERRLGTNRDKRPTLS